MRHINDKGGCRLFRANKTMTYKMIVLDLDDTLLRDDHTISPYTKEMLFKAQDAGVKVVLASGRPTYAMRALGDELRLADYGSYLLSFNGGRITNCQTNEDIFSSTLTLDDVRFLKDLSEKENVFIHTYVGDNIITDKNNEYTTIEADITGLPISEVDDFVKAVPEPPVKVLMVEDPEILKPLEKRLQQELSERFSVLRSKPYFLEFTEKGVTKGTTLDHLIKQLGIKREEVIAIGDSYNDQSMIEFAGLGVAMGNAPEDIKAISDYVTTSNMEDGVAHVVEKFIFGEA